MTKADSAPISESKPVRQSTLRQGEELTSSTRVDPAHELTTSVAFPSPEIHPPANPPPPDDEAGEKLRLQALQLATHLSGRQKELDSREAELNSRIARFESEARAARLWLEERQADLAAAEELLERQREELSARAATLVRREEESAGQQRILSEQEQALSQHDGELCRREQEVEERLERLAAAEAVQQKNEQLTAERCAEAERQVEIIEQLVAEHRRAMAELERKRQTVQRRAEHVDKCRAALEQLREELGHMHRETLAIRLATEELWVQLSGAAPPAALTRSLGRIRTRLAEQYAQANAELAEKKTALDAIRGQLDEQLKKLLEHKRQFERWAAGRQQECESQASRLVAREQELQHEEDHLRRQSRQWQAERLRYQQELRRLKRRPSPRRQERVAPAR